MSDPFPPFYEEQKNHVEEALDDILPSPNTSPDKLHEAMRYSTLNGGKRLRGVFVLEVGRLNGDSPDGLLESLAGCIELIHAYSLVHDDLPAMDDDDYRRGSPTCHRKFGEETAILCGDALLSLAFETMSNLTSNSLPNSSLQKCIHETARAAGSQRLIGGQYQEFELTSSSNLDEILEVYRNKTAALMELSLVLGAYGARLGSKSTEILRTAGTKLGISFQIQDDLLEREENFDNIGKDTDSDTKSDKVTVVQNQGMESAKKLAKEFMQEGIEKLNELPYDTGRLKTLAEFVNDRTF